MAELKSVSHLYGSAFDNAAYSKDGDENKPPTINQEQNGVYTAQISPTKTDKINEKQIRKKIYKNLFVISVAFLFNFTAFQSLSNLQVKYRNVIIMGAYGFKSLHILPGWHFPEMTYHDIYYFLLTGILKTS